MNQQRTSIRNPIGQDFRLLVETHQSRVYSIAYRILHDVGAAEEVAQDVFLALYRNLERIEPGDHLLNWLRRVAVQRATDAWRHRTTRIDFGAEEFQEEQNNGAASTFPLSEITDAAETAETRIEQLVRTLPPAQRSVLLLRYQEDMTPTEIADMLAMPLGTVKSHLQRALKLLRRKLQTERKEAAHA